VVRVSTCFNFWFLHSRIVNFIQEGHVVPLSLCVLKKFSKQFVDVYVHTIEDPPVPISNTEVKLDQAELVLRLETT